MAKEQKKDHKNQGKAKPGGGEIMTRKRKSPSPRKYTRKRADPRRTWNTQDAQLGTR